MSTTTNQYGFFFDETRCIDCRACVVSCRDWYNIPSGPVKLSRMFSWEEGTFPNTVVHYVFAPCYHCANPPCVAAAGGAIMKEGTYGAVLIDPAQANSPNLRAAAAACPYGAIVFDSDAQYANAYKCTMCIDRLSQGALPICVTACPMRALDFDTMKNLQSKYPGMTQQMKSMPPPTTSPSVLFKEQGPKKNLVTYDPNAALSLLMARPNGLPNVFNSPSDLTPTSPKQVGRSSLIMSAANVAQQISTTQNDES